MWNLEEDGTINKKFPGDFDTALDKKMWKCSKCGSVVPTESNDVFYVEPGHDFVYHRDSDGHLYVCKEKDGFRFAGEMYWEKPLEIQEKIVVIPNEIVEPTRLDL